MVRITPTICSFCSNGCGMFMRTTGDEPVGVLPITAHPVSRGRLCHRGWNRYQNLRSVNRLLRPLLRGQAHCKEVSWDDALQAAHEKISDLLNRHGPRSLGVVGSPWLTNEDNFRLSLFAHQVLKTNSVDGSYRFAAASTLTALSQIFSTPLGAVGSIPSLADCSTIVVIGGESLRDFSPVGSRIVQAYLKGSTIILADPLRAKPEHFYATHLPYDIETLALALAERRDIPDEVFQALEEGRMGLVFDADQVAPVSSIASLLSVLFQLSPSKDQNLIIIPLSRAPNLRGAWDMGIRPKEEGLNLGEMLSPNSDLKGLLIFGDDLLAHLPRSSMVERVKNLELLVVADRFFSETSLSAHVALPIHLLAETEGTMTNCEGRVQKLRPALPARGESRNLVRILSDLAGSLGNPLPATPYSMIRKEIGKAIPSYQKITSESKLDESSGLLLPPTKRNGVALEPPAKQQSPDGKYLLAVPNTLFAWSRNQMVLESPVLKIEYPSDRLGIRMNPQDARDLKVRMGEKVRITSERGETQLPVELDATLPLSTIVLPSHFTSVVESVAGKGEMDPRTRSLYYPNTWVTLEKT